MHLIQQLALILRNSSLNFGSHEQLVVICENLEHFVGIRRFRQLLLQHLGQLEFNFGSGQLVGLLGCIPLLLPFAARIQHIFNALHKGREGVTNVG